MIKGPFINYRWGGGLAIFSKNVAQNFAAPPENSAQNLMTPPKNPAQNLAAPPFFIICHISFHK